MDKQLLTHVLCHHTVYTVGNSNKVIVERIITL